ncbi:unnamed protein product [Acanthoscelides obtectus]|uniref:C2 domain-containing protein n=1 Tax=Acanthoscelides obtectus TaxID=200917 RepID=A0A9P0JTM9_ACAOB|nr:unnamed protein product [Acanthoscelides obtectus]CAK1621844.1 C2 domain-containing protein 3 [Acanthoscelides obtectus]
MLIEFWKLEESRRSLIGLARVSLHQFYLAFRNYVITQHLLKKELPVIGSDGFVTIYSPNSDKVIGQVEILAAIGLEEQINTLKLKRGFSSVKPKLLSFAADIRQKSDLLSSKSGTPRLVESTENLKQKEPLCLNQKYHGKGFDSNKVYQSSRNKDNSNILDFSGRQHKSPEEFKLGKVANKKSSTDVGTQSEMDEKKDNGPSSQDMLGSFLNHLIDQRQRNVCVENSTNTEPLHIDVGTSGSIDNARQRTNVELRKTSDLLDMLQNALATDKKENKEKEIDTSQAKVKAKVSILSANHLPSRKKAKPRKSKNRSSRNEDVSPSCYVTFESLVNSELYTTPVVSKGTSPVWNYTREVFLSSDFLTNGQKRLIFKVWRKSTNAVTSPNMQTDVVLGFAAVDLTVLLAGFPNIQGWFNIMDFSGKCNGQINIHIMPLEDLSKYCSNANAAKETKINDNVQTVQPPDQQEPSELLSRALKRKFVELDEITQRLRLRLSKVTNESDSSNDEMAEEFENDINALCIEDDFDTINFEDEAQKIQNTIQAEKKVENSGVSLLMEDEDGKGTSNYCNLMSCSENSLIKSDNPASSISLSEADNDVTGNSNSDQSINKDVSERERKKPKHTLDQQLQEGKQHINSLLEKLTLLSSGTLTSRYVSGCSTSGTNLDTEAMLEKLDHSSRPNIQSSLGFDPEKFEHLYGDVLIPSGQTSSSSLITEITGRRPAPDGEGGSSNSNSVSTSTLPSNNQK